MISCSQGNVETVPNRNSPPAILLRQASSGWTGKVVKTTLANLSHWSCIPARFSSTCPERRISGSFVGSIQIQRSSASWSCCRCPWGSLRRLGLEPILSRSRCPERDLVVALIVGSDPLAPSSKLATCRGLRQKAATSSLGSLPRTGSRHSGGPTLQCPGLAAYPPIQHRKCSRQAPLVRRFSGPL